SSTSCRASISIGLKTPVAWAKAISAGVSVGMVGRIMKRPLVRRRQEQPRSEPRAALANGVDGGKVTSSLHHSLFAESTMPTQGWKRLLDRWPWFRGEGRYPIAAYSEFMPPQRVLRKP